MQEQNITMLRSSWYVLGSGHRSFSQGSPFQDSSEDCTAVPVPPCDEGLLCPPGLDAAEEQWIQPEMCVCVCVRMCVCVCVYVYVYVCVCAWEEVVNITIVYYHFI